MTSSPLVLCLERSIWILSISSSGNFTFSASSEISCFIFSLALGIGSRIIGNNMCGEVTLFFFGILKVSVSNRHISRTDWQPKCLNRRSSLYFCLYLSISKSILMPSGCLLINSFRLCRVMAGITGLLSSHSSRRVLFFFHSRNIYFLKIHLKL